MHQRTKRHLRVLGARGAVCALALACTSQNNPQGPSPPPAHASPQPSRALKSSCGSGPVPQLPHIAACGRASAADDPRIDDFDDGNLDAQDGGRRGGAWYLFTDNSAGCIELLVDPAEASALHARGQGFSTWGAAFGMSLSWDRAHSRNCLYDASAYEAVRFRARGNASLRFTIGTKTSTLASLGGRCPDSEGCFDQYGRTLSLQPEWRTFEVDFCSLTQEGWGTPLETFTPGELVDLSFQVRSTRPFEIWVDDIELVPRRAGNASICSASCPLDQLPSQTNYDRVKTPKSGGAAGLSLFTFEQQTRDCGPLVRRYLTYLPKALKRPSTAPLLLLLPGTSSDAESMHQFMTGGRFIELAERDGFIVVYANPAPGAFTVPERPNGGRFSLDTTNKAQVDDIEYLKLIVEDLARRGLVSGNNPLYLAGHSIGGGLALEAALQHPERYRGVAAIMPFDGVPPNAPHASTEYTLDRVLVAFSRDDPDLPTGYHAVLASLAEKWANALGIAPKGPTERQFDDRVIEGNGYTGRSAVALRTRASRAKRLDYTDSTTGRAVRVIAFDRAGHFWPMPAPYEDDALLAEYGFRNQDLNMSDQVWEFFRASQDDAVRP
ncbi:MAG TPA: thioesterase domain-containing protein [Polyangiaceae bacterium]|nr:thioesterase domain-containing protein [Polyangiaceae bacterium]